MATYTPLILSGSTVGRPVQVNATSSPGTLLHTVSTATGAVEDMFLDVFNVATATANRQIVIELGSTATTSHLYANVAGQDGPYRMAAGLRLNGATGVEVRAFATATGAFVVAGGANRSV
jgi:hypothetical protein